MLQLNDAILIWCYKYLTEFYAYSTIMAKNWQKEFLSYALGATLPLFSAGLTFMITWECTWIFSLYKRDQNSYLQEPVYQNNLKLHVIKPFEYILLIRIHSRSYQCLLRKTSDAWGIFLHLLSLGVIFCVHL